MTAADRGRPWDWATRFALVATLLALGAYFAATTRDHVFVSPRNLINIAEQTSINTIIAVGMTLVIITAGIDLGVGSVVGLAAVISAGAMVGGAGFVIGGYRVELLPRLDGPAAVFLGLLVALSIGAVAGLANSLSIVRFRVTPFIATLAMMLMARGAALLYHNGAIGGLPEATRWLGQTGRIAWVPVPVYVTALVAGVAWVALACTPFGRHVYAVGGNEEAARLSGIRVGRVKVVVYTASGMCAALAGFVLAAQLGAGDGRVGAGYELDAIAAAVLGGSSLMGGRGTIPGTVLGALLIGVLDNGLTMRGVSPFAQSILKGLVILGAVILDQVREQPQGRRGRSGRDLASGLPRLQEEERGGGGGGPGSG